MFYKDRLQEKREENNLKLRDIDKLLNLKLDTYKNYEKENIVIPIKHLVAVCDYFNISLDYVFNFSTVEQYNNSYSDIDKMKAGLRLREFRKFESITQEKLAKILNTNQSVIANYERGRNIIATPFLYEICKKYKISADYLLGKIDEPKYLK